MRTGAVTHIPQVKLAKVLGVTPAAVCQWLSGRSRPSFATAMAIYWVGGPDAGVWLTPEEREQNAAVMERWLKQPDW